MTEFEHEVFKSRWGAEDQHMGWLISNDTESVNHLAGTKYEITFTCKQPSAIDKKRDLTGDDVKRLIFLVVQVEGRFKSRRHQRMFGQRKGPVGLTAFRSVKGL